MKVSKRLVAFGTGAAVAAVMAGSGTAAAAFPNISDCPTGSLYCIDVQSRTGFMDIKGFRVPIGESLEIRGGLASPDGSTTTFVAPRGTSGVFARPIQVPGGILGINFPLPGNAVTATAALAGPPSSLRVGLDDFSLTMPMKLELTNPLIGPFCQIGSNSRPANVRLVVGLTNPPGPNRPIQGRLGEPEFPAGGGLILRGNLHVDNSFAIPGATGCGINLGLINSLINAKLKLPSAAGNNTLSIGNDFAFIPR